jgi:hypothetical protein
MNDSTDWFLRLTQSQKSFYFAGLGLIAGTLSVGGWFLILDEYSSSTVWMLLGIWAVVPPTVGIVVPAVYFAKDRRITILWAALGIFLALIAVIGLFAIPAMAALQLVLGNPVTPAWQFVGGMIFSLSVVAGVAVGTGIAFYAIVPLNSYHNRRAAIIAALSGGLVALIFLPSAFALNSMGQFSESLAATVVGCLLYHIVTAVGLSLREWPQPSDAQTGDRPTS